MSEMLVIKLSDIVESPVALRTVNQESEKFATMRDSMRGPNGELALLNPISVRPVKSEDGSIAYQLVDGLKIVMVPETADQRQDFEVGLPDEVLQFEAAIVGIDSKGKNLYNK